jgi:hypothetical protein
VPALWFMAHAEGMLFFDRFICSSNSFHFLQTF